MFTLGCEFGEGEDMSVMFFGVSPVPNAELDTLQALNYSLNA